MSIKDKIENAREDDWLTKDLSEEELNKIKEEVNREKTIEVLQSHKFHWERLLREKICDNTEGTDFINAVDMAIKALQLLDKLDKTITEQIDISYDQVERQTLRWVLDKMSEEEE